MEVSNQLHVPGAILPGKDVPVATEQEARWAPEPDFTLYGRYKFPAPVENRIPAAQLIALLYNDRPYTFVKLLRT
jgi:hypothetical protein